MSDTALIIFIKNPELGKVKTRLARTVGNDKALQIYKALLEHTRHQAIQTGYDCYLFYSRHIDHNDNWSDSIFNKELQQGEDLGQRMLSAFKRVLQDYNKAIIIGSDCASLTSSLIKQAEEKLSQNDFVIGPAMDGGYYLLGMKPPLYPGVFQDIKWSTDSVFTATVTRIEAIKRSYALLPTISDIDTEEDWKTYGWEI